MLKLQLKDKPQQGLWLVGEKISLGSGKDNDLVLTGAGIEPHHAQILIDQQDNVVLHPQQGSCYVNGALVQRASALNNNDEIRIGQQSLLVLDSRQVKTLQQTLNRDHTVAQSRDTPQQYPPEQHAATGWSIVAEHPQLKDKHFLVTKTAVLGRGQRCDFVVPYKLLSREHARFTAAGHHLLLTDLDSSNGTFVNGKRIKEARLYGGETIQLARLSFQIHPPVATRGAADDEMNKTMVRPVISMDDALDSMQAQTLSSETPAVETFIPESVLSENNALPQHVNQRSRRALFIIAAALITIATGAWYLLPRL